MELSMGTCRYRYSNSTLFILALIGFGVAAGLSDIVILAIIGAIGGVIGVLIGGRGRFRT